MPLYLGCAGWSLPRANWPQFAADGSHLQRYASVLNAVEINSSFYRAHRIGTYSRWADSVPQAFRFSVKLPKQISHELRLRECEALLHEFLDQCAGLGEKLGCLLLQLPPSLAYDPAVAQTFFVTLRERFNGAVVLEPRHASWRQAQPLLVAHGIGQVAADPSPMPGGDLPSGWQGLNYFRLHGSPKIYYSAYTPVWLEQLAVRLLSGTPTWCIFDNTASGAAVSDVLALRDILAERACQAGR